MIDSCSSRELFRRARLLDDINTGVKQDASVWSMIVKGDFTRTPHTKSHRSPPLRKSANPPDIAAQFRDVLRKEGITQSELAARIGGTPAGVSRDLKGGLREAKLHRLKRLADAISYEVVITLRPKVRPTRRTRNSR
jgi:hypothetical protein